MNIPKILYHATYKLRLKSIKLKGLGAGGKRNWEDSQRGVVYLALDPNVAESYAETSDMVPDEWLDSIVILKIATAGLDPNKFHIDSNVQDNTGDTVEYHGIIPPSNISLYNQGMAEGIETKIRAKNQAVVKKLQGKEVKEDITQEDIITKLKARLGDYLSDLGQQIKKDPALKDKLADKPRDTMGPAVKTVTTDDGQTISIHGNEDDGFRISIKNKPATAKFKTVDEAALACNMFNARRKNPRINTDYVDEA